MTRMQGITIRVDDMRAHGMKGAPVTVWLYPDHAAPVNHTQKPINVYPDSIEDAQHMIGWLAQWCERQR